MGSIESSILMAFACATLVYSVWLSSRISRASRELRERRGRSVKVNADETVSVTALPGVASRIRYRFHAEGRDIPHSAGPVS